MCFKKKKKKRSEEEEGKKKKTFSKVLLVQESILIWLITISFIALAFLCVLSGMSAVEIGFLTVLPGVAWAAYGVSQTAYYKKSAQENTKDGIVYETAMLEAQEGFIDETAPVDFDEVDDGK